MANPEHLAILRQGVKVWNEWRKKNPYVEPDLSEAILQNQELMEIDLSGVNLFGTNLSKADLNTSDLSFANLVWANLRDANLGLVNLREAYLHHANLDEANLTGVDFRGAELSHADFHNVTLGWTIFDDVALDAVRGLDTSSHLAPSTIGIDTIFRSQGKIPEVFLRGCGVPETFIEYSRSLIGKHIHYFTCMISYSNKDERFCKRFYNNLRSKDVQVWRFAEDAKWGESVWGEIDKSIKGYDKVIVVCSKNLLQSPKVLREIDRALEREDRETKNILFPITIDRYLFDEWEHPRKADVLEKVVGTDFIGWNRSPAKYDAALKKLLKALRAGE